MSISRNMHNPHTDVVVQKPWGYEYLIYETNDVALWLLYIENGKGTSLHCHPMKTTGLILLNGKAELGFIADKKILKAPNKQMIRRGLFHSTTAMSEPGIFLLEIETPNDKEDLVRLEDSFGRSSEGYEPEENWTPKDSSHIWIKDPEINKSHEYFVGETLVTVTHISEISKIQELGDDEIVMFLQGGIGKMINNRDHLATVPGDIGKGAVLKKVANEMQYSAPNTIILRIGQ